MTEKLLLNVPEFAELLRVQKKHDQKFGFRKEKLSQDDYLLELEEEPSLMRNKPQDWIEKMAVSQKF